MLEKVRTASKAIARLEEIVAERAARALSTSPFIIWRLRTAPSGWRSGCGRGSRGSWTCM